MVLNWNYFILSGDIWQFWEVLNWGRVEPALSDRGRDSPKYTTMDRTAPQRKNSLAHNNNSAEAEKRD